MNGAPSSVLLLPWNNIDALEACLKRHAGEVAAVIMEPIMGNSGCIPPEPGYLQAVREVTLNHDVPADLRRGDHRDCAWRRAAPRNITASRRTSP